MNREPGQHQSGIIGALVGGIFALLAVLLGWWLNSYCTRTTPAPTPTPCAIPTNCLPMVTPTATSTVTLEPTYTPTPSPAVTPTPTPTPSPTPTPIPSYSLAINGVLIQQGQNTVNVPNGTVTLSQPPGQNGKYLSGTEVRFTATPHVAGATIMWEGANSPPPPWNTVASVIMLADRSVTLIITPPTPTPDLVSIHKPRLMDAIHLAVDANIEAYRNLDSTPLYNALTGRALQISLSWLEYLRQNGLHEVAKSHDLQFEHFTVSPDGLHAEVRVTETWESTIYRIGTKLCVNRVMPFAQPQTLFLEQRPNGWIVYDVYFDQPLFAPC
jgi:hypothetical protein